MFNGATNICGLWWNIDLQYVLGGTMADDLQEEIKKIAEKIPGCRYVSLVGYDGITVAQHIIDASFDVNLYDAELSSIMLASREVRTSIGLGAEKELIWLTESGYFIVHPVGDDFFIYGCLKTQGSNPGVARIELNKAKKAIKQIIYPET
jgi:predicted regulator of Ras-like GTPase activity (Roadblock/LC7/MglB family)